MSQTGSMSTGESSRAGGREWWAEVQRSAPKGLGGLWFGLTELADVGWHIYVAGTELFESADDMAEWAVGPYRWWPDGRYFAFPEAGNLDVVDALAAAVLFVSDLAPWLDVAVRGVAVGFDEGDFEIVYDHQGP
ncbi:MAG: hypothetical protein GY750_18780 [Lentisphaerae bacterium]|nr:hypothetical protein [Lentisphaerota bacterium]